MAFEGMIRNKPTNKTVQICRGNVYKDGDDSVVRCAIILASRSITFDEILGWGVAPTQKNELHNNQIGYKSGF